MNKKTLFLTAIKNNPNGCSINPNTLRPIDTKSGYFVSITDNERVKADYRIVSHITRKAKEMNLKDFFIGYWKDAKTGKHYFDLSLLVNSRNIALNIAKTFNQKAIFSNRSKQVVYC